MQLPAYRLDTHKQVVISFTKMPALSHVDTFFLLTKQLKDKLDNQTGAKHTSHTHNQTQVRH